MVENKTKWSCWKNKDDGEEEKKIIPVEKKNPNSKGNMMILLEKNPTNDRIEKSHPIERKTNVEEEKSDLVK